MRESRFSEEQIVSILQEAETGISKSELCREYGISDQTHYHWRSKYGGMQVSDVKKLKALEKENATLKLILGKKDVENTVMKAVLSKKL